MDQRHANTRSIRQSGLATLVGAALLLLSACQEPAPGPVPAPTPVPPTPVASPADFAFIFQWSSCGAYTLNTLDNRLTLTTNMTPPTTTTIDFTLSPTELGRIGQKVADINFFSYPDDFAIQLPPQVIRVYGISALYSFDVRSGNRSKVVRWKDLFSEPEDQPWTDEESQPSKTQATRLRELIRLIQQLVEAHPEFDQLPDSGGCA